MGVVATRVGPDFGAVGDGLASMIGALVTVVLILSVLMLVVSAVVWATASAAGNQQTVARARLGVWTAVGATVLAGAARAYVDFLIDTGSTL